MKILSMGAELFHKDGRTDMKKLIVAFRNFAGEPKNNGPLNSQDIRGEGTSHGARCLGMFKTPQAELLSRITDGRFYLRSFT
jgi:hypothetical protein